SSFICPLVRTLLTPITNNKVKAAAEAIRASLLRMVNPSLLVNREHLHAVEFCLFRDVSDGATVSTYVSHHLDVPIEFGWRHAATREHSLLPIGAYGCHRTPQDGQREVAARVTAGLLIDGQQWLAIAPLAHLLQEGV